MTRSAATRPTSAASRQITTSMSSLSLVKLEPKARPEVRTSAHRRGQVGGVDEHSFTDLHICGGGLARGAAVGGWTAGTGDYDGRMASWRDGAAYAPTERPDGFATPSTDALPAGEPYKAATPGPMAPPQSFDAAEQPALSQIAVEVKQRRNPRDSFEVASTTLTTAPGQPSGKRHRITADPAVAGVSRPFPLVLSC